MQPEQQVCNHGRPELPLDGGGIYRPHGAFEPAGEAEVAPVPPCAEGGHAGLDLDFVFLRKGAERLCRHMCPKDFWKPMNSGGGGDDTQGASWWFRDLQPDSGATPPFVTLRRDEAGFPGGDTCTLVIQRVYTRGSMKESTPLNAGCKARSHGCNSNGLHHMKGCFKHAPAHAPQSGAIRRNAPKGRAICGAIPMATQS